MLPGIWLLVLWPHHLSSCIVHPLLRLRVVPRRDGLRLVLHYGCVLNRFIDTERKCVLFHHHGHVDLWLLKHLFRRTDVQHVLHLRHVQGGSGLRLVLDLEHVFGWHCDDEHLWLLLHGGEDVDVRQRELVHHVLQHPLHVLHVQGCRKLRLVLGSL